MTTYINLRDTNVYNKTSQPLYLEFASGPTSQIEILPNKDTPHRHTTGRLTSVRNAQVQLRPWEPVQTTEEVEPGSDLQFYDGSDKEKITVFLNDLPILFKQREPTSSA